MAAFSLSALFIFHGEGVSRLFLIILFVVQPLVTLTLRGVLRAWFTSLRQQGYNTHLMLVVGTGRLARDFAERVEDRAGLGIRVIGHLAVPGETPGDLDRPILGSIDDIERVFHSRVVDEVAVCLEPEFLRYLDPVTPAGDRRGQDGPDARSIRSRSRSRTPAKRSSKGSWSARSSPARSTTWGWP